MKSVGFLHRYSLFPAAGGQGHRRGRTRSVLKERRGEITVAGVGQEGDDGLALVLGALGKLDARPDSRTGGNAHEHTLAMADKFSRSKGVVIRNGDDLVINAGIQHVRHKARTNALDLVRTRSALAQDRGGGGFHGDDLDSGLALLEELARAGQRAARADASNKNVDLTVGVGPDLGAGPPRSAPSGSRG